MDELHSQWLPEENITGVKSARGRFFFFLKRWNRRVGSVLETDITSPSSGDHRKEKEQRIK
jgi:hypothetical protein